jgi:iron complex outermembrane receptor protein
MENGNNCTNSLASSIRGTTQSSKKINISRLLVQASAIALGAGLIATDALAAGSAQLEEIVVSAQKRIENLQETPISITALTSATLEARSLKTLAEVSNATPNLVFDVGTGTTGGSSNAQIFIRGVGQTDFLFSSDPGVGIYIDDVYFPRAVGAVMDLLDFERIEVLRGPQGTLFGKNTIGGVINITSVKPGDTMGGYAQVTTGSRNRIDARGAVDVPLVEEKLSMRLSASTRHQDGYVKRILVGDDLGNTNSTGGRLQLHWRPVETWDIMLSGDITKKREHAAADEFLPVGPLAENPLLFLWNALVAPAFGAGVAYDNRYQSAPRTTQGTGPNYSDLDLWGASLIIKKDIDTTTVKSITAYREQIAKFGHDPDNSPLPYIQNTNDNRENSFSQELQVSGKSFNDKLKWVVGGFLFRETGHDIFNVSLGGQIFPALESFPPGFNFIPLTATAVCPSANPLEPCAGGAGNPYNVLLDLDVTIRDAIVIDSYAGYGHANLAVTDKLSLTAGLRYTDEKKKFTTTLRRNGAGLVTVPETTVKNKWNALTPKGGIEYRWTSDIMTYASVSRGFKSGGFNGRALSIFEINTFNPEYSLTYEIGAKTEWLDHRLRLNMAAFHNNYTDMQLTSVRAVQGVIVVVTENAGKSRVNGFEIEMTARPAPQLDISAGVGYTDAKYTFLEPGATISLNNSFPKTPKWTGNAAIQYSFDLGNMGTAVLGGNLTFRSKYYNEVTNLEILAQQSTVVLLGARLTLVSRNNNFELAVFGTNLTDERYKTNGLSSNGSFGSNSVAYGPPREWGLSLKAHM